MLGINVLILVSFSEGSCIPKISSGISPFDECERAAHKTANDKIQATLLEMKYIRPFVILSATIKLCPASVNSLGATQFHIFCLSQHYFRQPPRTAKTRPQTYFTSSDKP